ncbi:hypothetical protein L2E82_27870 [Cichorium intybus]|uniref:Uncharacterized protein n=1 Tax=Cichorium intybus TaxID=13427 RepID=A0ACB9CUG4_CICIN|nr:hypothetical protein L2E82_27870 [Cichorium intybus]
MHSYGSRFQQSGYWKLEENLGRVLQDVVATGGKYYAMKWATDAQLNAMKEKSVDSETVDREKLQILNIKELKRLHFQVTCRFSSKLQSALSSVERFPVVLNNSFKHRNSYVTVRHRRCTTYPCLKVLFVKEEGDSPLTDYPGDIQNVDPFSDFEAIETFLWPKVSSNNNKDISPSAQSSSYKSQHEVGQTSAPKLSKQTYGGQDIDYISIHSDAEHGGTRSYSYKLRLLCKPVMLSWKCEEGVVQVKRLALTETFCLNCGILALDEPTTNSDVPNAESLPGALLRYLFIFVLHFQLLPKSQISCDEGYTGLCSKGTSIAKPGSQLWPAREQSLAASVQKFELADASSTNLAVIKKNHCSNGAAYEGLKV